MMTEARISPKLLADAQKGFESSGILNFGEGDWGGRLKRYREGIIAGREFVDNSLLDGLRV
jgi:hypothetical protein